MLRVFFNAAAKSSGAMAALWEYKKLDIKTTGKDYEKRIHAQPPAGRDYAPEGGRGFLIPNKEPSR